MLKIRGPLVRAVAFAALLINVSLAHGQATATDSHAEPLAEHEMATLVWDILLSEFDHLATPTQIRLSMRGLNVAWIPAIPNVEFLLLSDDDVSESDRSCKPYYFFDSFERAGRRMKASFGRGTRCNSDGKIYSFRYKHGRLGRDRRGLGAFGRFGSHCECR